MPEIRLRSCELEDEGFQDWKFGSGIDRRSLEDFRCISARPKTIWKVKNFVKLVELLLNGTSGVFLLSYYLLEYTCLDKFHCKETQLKGIT